MLNIEYRPWVENALTFWTNRKPDRRISRKLIDWNIEMLTAALRRIGDER